MDENRSQVKFEYFDGLVVEKEGNGCENEEYASLIEPGQQSKKEEQVKKKYIRKERTCEECGKVTRRLDCTFSYHV